MIRFSLICLLISAVVSAEYLKQHNELILKDVDERLLVRALGAKESGTPPFLRQTWDVKIHDDLSSNHRIRFQCNDFRLYETNPCDKWKFTIQDNGKVETLCGSQYDLIRTSTGREMKFAMSNEAHGSVYVDCYVRLIEVYDDGTEVTTIAYHERDYEEIDSSEHGVTNGNINTTCPCGWTNKENNFRILNGIEARENEYPFIVALTERHDDWGFCGGSILTHYHILTAAHCTAGFQASQLSIVVGRHDRREYKEGITKKIDVAKVIDHPETQGTALHDISILVLEESIQFNQYVGPICLFNQQPDLTDQWAKIIGWGSEKLFHGGKERLQKLNTRITHLTACDKFYGIFREEVTQICAHATLNKGACSGDSGGPLVWLDPETNRYTQVGVVSAGRVCGGEDPTLYTRAQAYNSWIQSTISANYPNERTCSKIE